MLLWPKEGFRALIDCAAEVTNNLTKRAYDVCANNLVLLTLQAQLLHSRATCAAEAPATTSIDLELIRSFIVNAKRALGKIELILLTPSLLSLQALLSVCTVSQTSLSGYYGTTFRLSVHVAKSIGLHQWNSKNSASYIHSETQDKRNGMCCKLHLGRTVAWSSGCCSSSPSVAAFERDLLYTSDNEDTSHLASQISLLRLEEQVYIGLHSDEATNQAKTQTRKIAISQGQQLQDWATGHREIRESHDDDTPTDVSLDGVGIRYCAIQSLAAWPMADDAEASRVLLDVRQTMRVFQRLWRATAEWSQYPNLSLCVPAKFPTADLFDRTLVSNT
ncbi:hypothetical protein G7046_g5505 [Stylonectria norvegica]|nr:hypothetical protein G7046_g5505 [Stylonectria norvegica]